MAVVACVDCGQEFEAKRSDAVRCKPCQVAHRKAYLREYDHGKRRAACPDCGADMGARASYCLSCSNKRRGDKRRAENNGYWRGGKSSAGGYVLIRTAHKSGAGAYTPEHRMVWEQAHGKSIPKGWVVHHLNGVKDDNRPENLAAMSRHYHHHHPREALRPYEVRIAFLEEYIRSIGHEPPVGELPEVEESHSH